MIDTTLYDLLGVRPSATVAGIKAAFRVIAKTHHPDHGGDGERFIALTQAYNVLSNPERRKLYDETGVWDAEGADKSHADLIVTLSGALNHVLSKSRLPIESTDIVAEMRRLVTESRDLVSEELAGIEQRLGSLRAVRARIKRKGEAKNLFVKVIDSQIDTLAEAQRAKGTLLYAQQRALDELEGYDSVVEVIRSVQSGLYGGEPEAAAAAARP